MQRVALTPSLVAAALLAGCGSDDSSTSPAPEGRASFSSYDVTTQADIDSLVALATPSFTVGKLTIAGSDIVNLVGPAGLTRVSGSLIIEENPSLERIGGFENLEHANVIIQNNPAVTVIEGFDKLNNEFPHLSGNESLVEVTGFSGVTDAIGASMGIAGSPELVSARGFRNVTTGGDGFFGLFIADTALENFEDFQSATTIDGRLTVADNPRLANLDGLANLTTVTGEISIRRNDQLTNLDGLANLTIVTGKITIRSNEMLPTSSAEALVERLRSLGFDGEADIQSNLEE
jgi:hypothetical protein